MFAKRTTVALALIVILAFVPLLYASGSHHERDQQDDRNANQHDHQYDEQYDDSQTDRHDDTHDDTYNTRRDETLRDRHEDNPTDRDNHKHAVKLHEEYDQHKFLAHYSRKGCATIKRANQGVWFVPVTHEFAQGVALEQQCESGKFLRR